MKKFVTLLLAFALISGLCACGSKEAAPKTPQPEDTVKEFCEAMKSFDIEKMQSLSDEKSEDLDFSDEMEQGEEMFINQCRKLAQDISYEVKNSEITDKDAKVTVDFKYNDASDLMGEVFGEFIMQALSLAFSGESEEEMNAKAEELFIQIFEEKAEEHGYKEGLATVEFPCALKEDNTWKIKEIPENVFNVVTGDILKALDELQESLEPSDWGMEESEPSPFADAVYDIDNLIIAEDDAFTVTLRSAEYDGFWGTEFTVACEDKTEDKHLNFVIGDVVVNGYVLNSWFYQDVLPGKTGIDVFSIMDDDLIACGLGSIDELRFTLSVTDLDDYSGEYLLKDTFTVYPTGLSSADIAPVCMRQGENEIVLADTDQFKCVILETEMDEFLGYCFNVYFENNSDMNLYYGWNDVSVNDIMCDPYFGATVPAHSAGYAQACFTDLDIENTGLSFDDFEKLEFTLHVADNDDYEAVSLMDDVFTLDLK